MSSPRTTIPRTLHLSLAGLRDMTLMQTPPRDRSPVLTFVEPWDEGLIEEGIARELDRGGQVFFVHNRIETIEAVSDRVRRVVPRAGWPSATAGCVIVISRTSCTASRTEMWMSSCRR